MNSPERLLQITTDGSHTIAIPSLEVTYHSKHGAVNESTHVFIEAGLRYWKQHSDKAVVNIFEMGFGTGLNALLTYIESPIIDLCIYYETIEMFPLEKETIAALNYCDTLRIDLIDQFYQMHECKWNEDIAIAPFFTLYKSKTSLLECSINKPIDIVYFDAFAPEVQPELWTLEVFQKLYAAMAPNGVLVTYCSKADVRRAMVAAGFRVYKIQGPPYKREMVRAVKEVLGSQIF